MAVVKIDRKAQTGPKHIYINNLKLLFMPELTRAGLRVKLIHIYVD